MPYSPDASSTSFEPGARPRRRLAPALLAAALWSAPLSVQAQQHDPAAAQALFEQARELMQQNRFAEACPKLQESNRLDPGIGTQFHLADCYEQSGRVASAWATFLDVASQARASGQLDREKVASKRAEKLQPRLPRLVVDVPEANQAPGLEIRRNGTLVGEAQWGTPLPVDPGALELVVTAPGKRTLRQSLRLEEGNATSFSVPALEDGASEGASPAGAAPLARPSTPVAPAAPPVPAPAPAPPRDEAQSSGKGPWVLTLAGAGVVGLGVGTAFAFLAKSKYDDSKADCDLDNPNRCGPTGLAQRDSARTRGNVATVSLIAGGAALAGAGIVWLVGGSGGEPRARAQAKLRAVPALGPSGGAFAIEGSF